MWQRGERQGKEAKRVQRRKDEQDKEMRQRKKTKAACVTAGVVVPLAKIRYLEIVLVKIHITAVHNFGIWYFMYIVYTITLH